MKRWILVLAIAAVSCAERLPAPRPQSLYPIVGRDAEFRETCGTIWLEELGRAIDETALLDCVHQAQYGRTGEAQRALVHASADAIAWRNRPRDVDPSQIPLGELARVRGAMWTARYPLPWGPRPNQADNILALAAIAGLQSPADRALALKAYTDRGYTHGVIGAWRPGPYSPYHDYYPDLDLSFDRYLDLLQELWNAGVTPVVFIKPDNWSCSQLETLTPFYSQPRAQRLVRYAVPGGWEPSKDTSNAEWVCWLKWGARVLPNAVRAIHLEADFDAPGNNADFTDPAHGGDAAKYIGMPEAWRRVAPFLHEYLIQNYGYMNDGTPEPSPWFLKNFTDQFRLNPAPGRGSMADRFTWGYAAWPTSSAWGPNVGICPVAAEYAATADFHWNWPERYAQQLGDAAIGAGACGYLDGGTVDVSRRR